MYFGVFEVFGAVHQLRWMRLGIITLGLGVGY